MSNFGAADRASILENISNQEFDLLIIGGGITGAGIALDASSRGLKTALVEKKDFAWGTSSRSTKLVHGGLRYLKQFEVQLVREVGRERAIVHRNARHVVVPERMLLPIVENGSLGKRLSSLGLWVYDYVAGVEKDERRKMLNKKETQEEEPLLRTDILKGGGLYYEYRTDDARLTIETMKQAVSLGATCLNYMEAVDYVYDKNKQVDEVLVKDQLSGKQIQIRAKKIVNATGPWVDELRRKDSDDIGRKRLHLTKGVHIVLPYERLPLKQSCYFDVFSDNRMMFAIPRGGITYIGTTDTSYKKEIDSPNCQISDVQYILDATNAMFPGLNLGFEDVRSSWSGLRPLIHEKGKSPSELSRKDEIFISESGLISIAGGKLTGYRKMAERIVDLVVKNLNKEEDRKIGKCQTETLQLSGGDFDTDEALDEYIVDLIGAVKQIELKPAEVKALVHKYGRNTDLIIEKAFEIYPQVNDSYTRILHAELWYGLHHEMVQTLNDFIIRRSGRLYFERDSLEKALPIISDYMAKKLNWSPSRIAKEKAAFEKEYEAVIAFKNQLV